MLNTNFETIDQAKKELTLRSSLLMKSDKPSSQALGRKLSYCTEDDPCHSGACPLCARTQRIALIQEGMAYYNMGGDWRMVTTIDYAHAKSDKKLANLDVKKENMRLYQRLTRCGFNGPIFGSLDFDYHKDSNKWMIHHHFIAPYEKIAFNNLRETMKNNKNIKSRPEITSRPMLQNKITEPLEAISYLFKSYHSEVVAFIGSDGKRRTNKRRLSDKHHELCLLVMDRIGFNGFVFRYKIK